MSFESTPNANRLHIGIFGKRNSGKSSLLNAITNQEVSIVSSVAGTTTDSVYKPMEIIGVGACVFIDTAGFDDFGELGDLRIQKTLLAIEKSDIALIVFSDLDIVEELKWYKKIKAKNIPIICIINKIDELSEQDVLHLKALIKDNFLLEPILISSKNKINIDKLINEILRILPENFENKSITKHLVKDGDTVLLVMPQNIQAPKGRLILPQVQTIRDLLENNCTVICSTTNNFLLTLEKLKNPPNLIITDSQEFKFVFENKPKESLLTSFSVLFAEYKGDVLEYIKGSKAIESLNNNSIVLIAEACAHAPAEEDIGRVKIPNLLRKKYGDLIKFEIVAGTNFPEDLSKYSLIIQCGCCMFNRKYVLNRIFKAQAQQIPITNYGITIAKLNNILDKIVY